MNRRTRRCLQRLARLPARGEIRSRAAVRRRRRVGHLCPQAAPFRSRGRRSFDTATSRRSGDVADGVRERVGGGVGRSHCFAGIRDEFVVPGCAVRSHHKDDWTSGLHGMYASVARPNRHQSEGAKAFKEGQRKNARVRSIPRRRIWERPARQGSAARDRCTRQLRPLPTSDPMLDWRRTLP